MALDPNLLFNLAQTGEPSSSITLHGMVTAQPTEIERSHDSVNTQLTVVAPTKKIR